MCEKYSADDVTAILMRFINDTCDTFSNIDKIDLIFYAQGWSLAKIGAGLPLGESQGARYKE